MARPLGNHQSGVLRHLVEIGSWSLNCGWVWGGPMRTRRILDTLVTRGLVDRADGVYAPTDAGRRAAAELRRQR